MLRKTQRPSRDPYARPDTSFRPSKRRREETDFSDLFEKLSELERGAKKQRVVARDEPIAADSLADRNADLAVLMRRHLSSLDWALRRQWTCVCQKCSGLSVRLSLPQQKKDSRAETSFEVFFGVRSVLATTLQEAKITVR